MMSRGKIATFGFLCWTISLTCHCQDMLKGIISISKYGCILNTTLSKARAAEIFNSRLKQLSNIFSKDGVNLNLVLVGACDGTHDRTIEAFFEQSHWRAILIEPMSYNFVDLVKNIDTKKSRNRCTAVRAVVTNKCDTETINITHPDWVFRNEYQPHWMLRQTATLNQAVILGMESHRKRSGFTHELLQEEVPCLLGRNIADLWTEKRSKQVKTSSDCHLLSNLML